MILKRMFLFSVQLEVELWLCGQNLVIRTHLENLQLRCSERNKMLFLIVCASVCGVCVCYCLSVRVLSLGK